MTAVAGGVLAITAFLGGAAVGHAWNGTSTPNPGTGRFGPGNGFPGNGNGFQNQPGQGQLPNQNQPGQSQFPGQSQQTNPQGRTQQSDAGSSGSIVRQIAWISTPAGATPPAPLELYGLWRLPVLLPDAATVRGKLEPA